MTESRVLTVWHAASWLAIVLAISLLLAGCNGVAYETPVPGTPVPRPTRPPLAGTPVPRPPAAIAPETAGQLVQLARWGKGEAKSAAWSPDGSRLAIASSAGVGIYDAQSLTKTRFIETDAEAVTVDFSPDGNRLLIGLASGVVEVWDMAASSDAPVDHVETRGWWSDDHANIAFSPDRQMLAAGGSTSVSLQDLTTGETVRYFESDLGEVNSVAFSPDGRRLAGGTRVYPDQFYGDIGVFVWDVATGQQLQRFIVPRPAGYVNSLAFSPNGQVLAVGDDEGNIRRWDLTTGEARPVLDAHPGTWVTSVVFSPDGEKIASGSRKGLAKVWDAATGEEIHTLVVHGDGVRDVVFSADGQRLATVSRPTVKVWDVDTGEEIAAVHGYTEGVNDLAFFSDGETLISGTSDRLRLWDVQAGEEVGVLSDPELWINSLAVAPDGQTLALGGHDEVRLWDIVRGVQTSVLLGHTSSTVWDVAFSPDGQLLASGSQDQTARLWDVSAAEERRVLQGHSGVNASVWGVAWSPDGEVLASASGGWHRETVGRGDG